MTKKLLLTIFLFVIGIYNVNALEIPVNSYVIGEYLFTRDGSDSYNGQLSTDYIMLASQSVDSKDLDDMTIYFKIGESEYIDGATGELIEGLDDDDLSENIKYYNMKKIPTVKTFLSTDFAIDEPDDKSANKEYYYLNYVTSDLDEDDNLDVSVDYYGTSEENGGAMFVPSPDLISDDSSFTKLTNNYLAYDKGTKNTYTVLAYPYVNVVNQNGESKKVYLDFNASYVMSFNTDLSVNGTIENGKMKVSVVDSTGKNYKLNSAIMYRKVQETYFDAFDLADLFKQNSQLKKWFSLNTINTIAAFMGVKESYNDFQSFDYEVVDFSSITTNDVEEMPYEIKLNDLGSFEGNTEGEYLVVATAYDDNGNAYIVQSDPITGLVTQLTIDDDYLSSDGLDLFKTIYMYSFLLSR